MENNDPNTQQDHSPDIYNLPIELLADTFDYLSLEDLWSLRLTSKWFHQVAGFCFQKNYSALVMHIKDMDALYLNVFQQFIQAIAFKNDYYFWKFANRITEQHFQQLKSIKLVGVNSHTLKNEQLQTILSRIECLNICGCSISLSVIESIPVLCPNLKHLSIHTNLKNEWIACKYPKLESFRFTGSNGMDVEISPFLKMNPNIRRLEISSEHLWNNRDSLKASRLTLDELTIKINSQDEICRLKLLLHELYYMGLYKRLNIKSSSKIDIEFYIGELTSLHALIKLHLNSWQNDRFALSAFRHLEEIYVYNSFNINDIEATVANLKNLERIQFKHADVVDLIPFIRKSRKLTKIIVSKFVLIDLNVEIPKGGLKFISVGGNGLIEQTVVNLSTLNAERAKLPNATKITLIVDERTYLATKWAMKATDFEYIQMRRFEFSQ